MAIITLTTDWNKGDYYIGALKGKILSNDPSTVIVDISHQVQPFNVMQAAFILRNCWFEFPKETIHIIAINAALTENKYLLIIKREDQYFIVSDNGIAGLLFGDKPDNVYKVVNSNHGNSFVSLNTFIETAFRIIKGEKPEKIGTPTEDFVIQIPLRPVIDKNLINGSVIYIDSFSNAITNISVETFDKVGKGKPYEIFVQSNHYRIDRLNKTYSDSASGELLALFNSVGLLEIAINNGNAADLLNLTTNSAIRIKFYDEKPAVKLKLTGA
jgi:S-adenosyl-L-methionine hydrolase (adenosine-forming)